MTTNLFGGGLIPIANQLGELCPQKSGTEMLAALSECDQLLRSHGFRIDRHAKCASGRVLHWARVIEESGREIVSSGGWFETEEDAVLHAVAMLEFPCASPCP